ncbi:hypothetical protein HOG98_07040 [bacterium]|jgi:hypothetical protein|nr:hypothetical protein [bacterium]
MILPALPIISYQPPSKTRVYTSTLVSNTKPRSSYQMWSPEKTLAEHTVRSLSDVFLIETFVGFDTLLNFFYARKNLGSVSVKEILDAYYRACDQDKESIQIGKNPDLDDIANKYASKAPLSSVLGKENVFKAVSAFLYECSKAVEKNELEKLVQAEPDIVGAYEEYAESMEEFDKVDIKRHTLYDMDSVFSLPAMFGHIFNIPKIISSNPLYLSQNWQLMSLSDRTNYYLQSSIVDMLLYNLLLHDGLPAGAIKFYFLKNFSKASSGFSEYQYNFFHLNKLVKSYKIKFDFKNKECDIFEDKRKVGRLNITITKAHHVEIHGIFLRDKFLLTFSSEHNGRFNENIRLQDWKGDYLGSRGLTKEIGWRSHKTGEQKKMKTRYSLYKNNSKDLMIHQKGSLGEDVFELTTWFQEYLFLPLAATGMIINEKEHKYSI